VKVLPRRRRRWCAPAALLAVLASLVLLAAPAPAQENADCFMCHEDPDLAGERGGAAISVHVDPAAFDASVHAGMECVLCHMDLEGTDFPHADDVERVACDNCHDVALEGSVHAGTPCSGCHGTHDIAPASKTSVDCGHCHVPQGRDHRRSLHGQAARRGDELAPACVDCHGSHDVLSPADPASPTAVMNVPVLCGRCHQEGSPVTLTHDIPQDRILQNYSMSIHGEGLFRQGLTVTAVCTSCHTSHLILPHTDPESSIHRDNVAQTCEKCHGQIEQVHRKVVEGHLWREEPEKVPACVDCHSPHKIRKVFYTAGSANQDCLRCHGEPDIIMQRDGETVSLYVDAATYNGSAHANTACAQCHTDVTPSLERACETVTEEVDCGVCHAEPVQEFQASTHGVLLAANDPDAPSCQDCHEKHAVQKHEIPASPTYPRNVPFLCAKCHRQGEKAAVRINSEIDDIFASYLDSIHGKGLVQSGLVVTATCPDCHSPHGELPPEDPRSTVNKKNVAHTCGTCHHGIEETYRTSIHATGKPTEEHELPTCEDCHSSHTITRVDQGSFRMAMMDQCGRCHETEAETFFDTFHGKVSRLGDSKSAKCYDCHGTHDILPPSDPDSTLGREHVVATCGKCHEGSHRRFAGYLTHATHHDVHRYPWLFWSFWGMTALLVGTLTFAMGHTLAWLLRLWLTRDQWKHHKAAMKANPGKLYRRFNRYQRTLHLFMLLSFLILALTGMTLKFSYAAWAQWIGSVLGGFDTTGILHRMGAITLFTVFFLHLWDVRRRKKSAGKTWKEMLTGPRTILFTLDDIKQVIQSIRWFFGIGPRPQYGRFTYWEKFDYFAVFWGVMVIGSTGLLLWFPELFTRILPGWSVNVATIIHSDEALLAVAFIFTIHFFNTHFRPDKFPMDVVMFTGRVPLEELKHDKPGEYEMMVASGELEKNLVEPIPAPVERGFRIFGFIALGVGLSLIALILYAMLVAYR
jgi:cytochrome b subunit of formate dehydrogenase